MEWREGGGGGVGGQLIGLGEIIHFFPEPFFSPKFYRYIKTPVLSKCLNTLQVVELP